MQFTFKIYQIQYLNGHAHYTTRIRKKKDKDAVMSFSVTVLVLIIHMMEREYNIPYVVP